MSPENCPALSCTGFCRYHGSALPASCPVYTTYRGTITSTISKSRMLSNNSIVWHQRQAFLCMLWCACTASSAAGLAGHSCAAAMVEGLGLQHLCGTVLYAGLSPTTVMTNSKPTILKLLHTCSRHTLRACSLLQLLYCCVACSPSSCTAQSQTCHTAAAWGS